jgi:ATP-dependent DNA helicase RecG
MSKLSPIVKAVIYTMIYTAYFSQSVMMRHSRRLSMTSNSKATSFDLAGKQATSVLLSSVKSLKGVGPKTIDMLKNLGIINIADALFHFPTSIIDRTKRTLISKAVIGSVVTLELTVIQEKKGFNGSPHIFQCMDEDKVIVNVKCFYQKGQTEQIIWNNLRKLYKPNSQVIISGKLQLNTYSGDFDIVPEVALPASEDKAVIEKAFRVEPVYGLTQGLTNKKMRSIIEDSLLQLSGESESLASDWMLLESRNKRSWPTHMEAFKTLHTPLTNECLQINSPARTRLAHDELMTQFLHQAEKMREKKEDPLYILASELDFSVDGSGLYTSKLEDILPFKLTTCQRTAMDEVWKDMAGRSRMSRLVQGDVGSGKTVVAIMAILRAIEDGKQGAMLAPTEILAKQHYEVLSKYFEAISDAKPDSRKLRVELITGTVKGKVRLQLLDDLKNGLVDALVGTHALLGEAVADSFPSLGIVVIDEDQKFGVNQRDSLALRANTLFTTATPIPRSLMLLLVDGYSVSSLIEKPPLKRPIKTIILGSSLTDKIITRLGAHIPNGSKVFWVAPSIIARGNSVGFSVTERYLIS